MLQQGENIGVIFDKFSKEWDTIYPFAKFYAKIYINKQFTTIHLFPIRITWRFLTKSFSHLSRQPLNPRKYLWELNCLFFYALHDGLRENSVILCLLGQKLKQTFFEKFKNPIKPRSHKPILLVRELMNINPVLHLLTKFHQNRSIFARVIAITDT